jgi:hypothetical protein
MNAQDASIQLWKPDLSTLPLTARHGSVTLPFTGVDNYHALVVQKDWGNLQETLIRYVYMHGKPSGHSTRELTAAEKASFEIVPDPVPREHQHYHSAQRWNFLLRFNGAPAASVPVRLLTSNGSELGSVSDANGRVSLMVPDDFSLLGPDVRDRRTAEFSLSAELERDGINYQTQLSAEYRVDPGRWQSLGLGVFVTGIGLVDDSVLIAYSQMLGHLVENLRLDKGLAYKVIAAGRQDNGLLFLKCAGRDGDDDRSLSGGGGLDLARGFVAIQHRHTHVHPNQVRLPVVVQRYCFLSIGGLPHCEAYLFQQLAQKASIISAIIDDQDAIAWLVRFQSYNLTHGLSRRDVSYIRQCDGDDDGEGAAMRSLGLPFCHLWRGRRALDGDVATHQLNEFPADGQAQPGAPLSLHAAGRLAERLKELVHRFRLDAHASVSHLKLKAGECSRFLGIARGSFLTRRGQSFDPQRHGALLRKLDGIAQQVDQHLTQLAFIGPDVAGHICCALEIEL